MCPLTSVPLNTLAASLDYLPPVDLLLCPVEVFRTDVATVAQRTEVLQALRARFPALRSTLDLDDCDRVLRVQSFRPVGPALWVAVADLVRCLGVVIEVLPD